MMIDHLMILCWFRLFFFNFWVLPRQDRNGGELAGASQAREELAFDV